MSTSKKIAKAVAVTVLSAALAGATTSVMAKSHSQVKCYGIAKKGKNDCGTKNHACAGQATQDNQPNEWVYASKKACKKQGGRVENAKN